MDRKAELIDYHQTGYFSKIVTDYISQNGFLADFYAHPVSEEGISSAIHSRNAFKTNRKLITQRLQQQYKNTPTSNKVISNIEALSKDNTYTICTAHQPNIFTGHLYFIYKIIHIIRLADELNKARKDEHFVPVYYMGSEDADLEELGHIFIHGEKYEWATKQTGAVGRMLVDDGLLKIIEDIRGQVLPEPFGSEIIELLKKCYVKGQTIGQSTFMFLDKLFGRFGLVVLLPDDAALKSTMLPVFEDDLLQHTPSSIVHITAERLSGSYKVQANPRDINLFYLLGDKRERIIAHNNEFRLNDSGTTFTKQELLDELQAHPERFSPNVILRGLYQETILPNIIFVGGGGELAYWLELKDLFEHYKIPYPLLILRNSFLIADGKISSLMNKLQLAAVAFFEPETILLNKYISTISPLSITLENEKKRIMSVYDDIKIHVKTIDATLGANADALKTRALHKLESLEKKMMRAEKRKFDTELRQVSKIRSTLFPNGQLQERVENLIPFYARWGTKFLDIVYQHSNTLEQKLVVISEK